MNLFYDKKIKQILEINDINFYSTVECLKLNALRSAQKIFYEYPFVYGVSIGGMHLKIKQEKISRKRSNKLNPFLSGSPEILIQTMVDIMSGMPSNITPLINVNKYLILGGYVDSLAFEIMPKIENQIKESLKKEFSFMDNLSDEVKEEFLKDFKFDENQNKIIKIQILNSQGNINKNFKDEVYDFLGDELIKKINYSLLNSQLGEKLKTKLRKI